MHLQIANLEIEIPDLKMDFLPRFIVSREGSVLLEFAIMIHEPHRFLISKLPSPALTTDDLQAIMQFLTQRYSLKTQPLLDLTNWPKNVLNVELFKICMNVIPEE